MNFYLFLVIFVAVDLLLLFYVLYARSKKGFSKAEKTYFYSQWMMIREEHDQRHAVLDADKLLNLVLQKKGYAGGVGEQLKRAEKLFSGIDEVWKAHKLRNSIAHELDLRVTSRQAQQALSGFEKALKDLGAL